MGQKPFQRKLGAPASARQKKAQLNESIPLHTSLLVNKRAKELLMSKAEFISFVVDCWESDTSLEPLHCPRCGGPMIKDAELICETCDFWVGRHHRHIHS